MDDHDYLPDDELAKLSSLDRLKFFDAVPLEQLHIVSRRMTAKEAFWVMLRTYEEKRAQPEANQEGVRYSREIILKMFDALGDDQRFRKVGEDCVEDGTFRKEFKDWLNAQP